MRISDWSSDVCSSDLVGTVEKALLEAAVLVVVLLILFLGDWRAAAIVAVTLPLAALITFLFMQGMGLSANLMSLGGLAIAIGLLVDGSIVVVENIVERLGRAHEEGTPRLNLVYQAARSAAHTSGLQSLMRTSYAVFC